MGVSWLRVRQLVRKEFRQLLRDPRSRPIIFVTPIIQLLLFGYAVSTDVRHTATIVLDQDHSFLSRELVATFTASGYFDVVREAERPADLAAALDRGDAIVALQIPAGFGRDVAAGGAAAVQVLIDGSDANTGTVAQGYAQLIIQRFGLAHVPSGAGPPAGIDLRARAWYNPELASRDYNVPAVVGVLLLLVCLLLTSLSVVREREVGTLDQLLVSPVTPTELIVGKTLPVVAIALVDLVFIATVARLWFHIPFEGSPLTLTLAAVVYILAGLSAGLLISTVSNTQQEAFMVMFLFTLPAVILSGFFYPISSMPVVFQWLTYVNPVRYFLEIVRGIFLKGNGLAELWTQFVALAALAGAGLSLAIGRFRRDYG